MTNLCSYSCALLSRSCWNDAFAHGLNFSVVVKKLMMTIYHDFAYYYAAVVAAVIGNDKGKCINKWNFRTWRNQQEKTLTRNRNPREFNSKYELTCC